jgi:hypothetical protein
MSHEQAKELQSTEAALDGSPGSGAGGSNGPLHKLFSNIKLAPGVTPQHSQQQQQQQQQQQPQPPPPQQPPTPAVPLPQRNTSMTPQRQQVRHLFLLRAPHVPRRGMPPPLHTAVSAVVIGALASNPCTVAAAGRWGWRLAGSAARRIRRPQHQPPFTGACRAASRHVRYCHAEWLTRRHCQYKPVPASCEPVRLRPGCRRRNAHAHLRRQRCDARQGRPPAEAAAADALLLQAVCAVCAPECVPTPST